ncbi:hypothetical protein Tco_0227381, partial [Tanacetum coccineum]
MLHLDPIKRILAKAALEHEYFKDVGHVPIANFDELAAVGNTFLDSFHHQGLELIRRPSNKTHQNSLKRYLVHPFEIFSASVLDTLVHPFEPLFSMHKFSKVDPIVASFSGGAVRVISALIVVEIIEQQDHKRCKYCLGTGYLACARCASTGEIVLIDPVASASSEIQPLSPLKSERCSYGPSAG